MHSSCGVIAPAAHTFTCWTSIMTSLDSVGALLPSDSTRTHSSLEHVWTSRPPTGIIKPLCKCNYTPPPRPRMSRRQPHCLCCGYRRQARPGERLGRNGRPCHNCGFVESLAAPKPLWHTPPVKRPMRRERRRRQRRRRRERDRRDKEFHRQKSNSTPLLLANGRCSSCLLYRQVPCCGYEQGCKCSPPTEDAAECDMCSLSRSFARMTL